jgi:subtilisin family serine protease
MSELTIQRFNDSTIQRVGSGRHRWFLVLLLAAFCTPSQAAQLSSSERELLTQQAAKNGGYAGVIVSLAALSLDQIRERGAVAIQKETEAIAGKLRSQLGDQVLPTGTWNNGMGQVGLLVTQQGLALLEQSADVKALQPDSTRGLRDLAWMSLNTRRAIALALQAHGVATVDIVLNSEIGYDIGRDGRTVYRPSTMAADEHARLLQRLKTRAGAGLKIDDDRLARQGASAKVRAQIDRAAYFALRSAPEVRALRVDGVRDSQWPEEVLTAASAADGARVILSLQGAEGYSPYQGYLSAGSWATQAAAHRRAMDELLADIGAKPVEPRLFPGIGALSVWLSRESLQALYARRDARVRAVELVKPMGGPALLTSMSAPLVNMAPAWAAGYRGAGQAIIVLDTGVRRDHQFFKDGTGTSRVTYEACFGTTDSIYKSICPPPPPGSPPTGPGDSVLSQVGSGLPYNDAAYCSADPDTCSHGTHVAGIAAGRSQSSLSPSGIQGMVPDAQLVAVQLFSYPKTDLTKGAKWINDDLLEALTAVVGATQPNAMSPFIVNASLQSSLSLNTCDYFAPSISMKVNELLSQGVPFVASTGNNTSDQYIGFPACIATAIKVSAVFNTGSGNVRLPKANLANPAMFADNDPATFEGPILLAPGGGEPETTQGVLSATAPTITSMGLQSGTSMAAPHVSGMLAAYKAANPLASVADGVAWILTTGSIDVTVPLGPTQMPTTFRRIRYPGP